MIWLYSGLGAIAAGLFLSLREFLPWLEARRTGRLRTRGARSQLILRDQEPERFEILADRRLKAAGPGALFALGGVFWLGWNMLGLILATTG